MRDYSKSEARMILQTRLDSMSDHDFLLRSQEVQKNVGSFFNQLLSTHTIQSVSLYAPIAKWREVDVSWLKEKYVSVRFDYVSSSKNASFPTEMSEVVLIPLYGFTLEGFRLGHGVGWYDRFLSGQHSALKVGIGLDAGLIEFPIDSHDIPMDYILTESRREIPQKRNHLPKTPL